MPGESVEQLREQLRERGYLTHGIERWFALDPWRSRTFWVELAIVAAKAAAVIAAFGALPQVAVMLSRNHPLTAGETLVMTFLYAAAWFTGAFGFIAMLGLLMKLRPELAIDTPRALLGIGLAAAAVVATPVAVWWSRFDAPPSLPELGIGLALTVILYVVSTIVVSAALLTFSVYELRRVPAIHSRPRTLPLTIAAAALMALLFVPAYLAQEKRAPAAPIQVVTTPSSRHIALVAVDGLTVDIFRSRPGLAAAFRSITPARPLVGASTTERWATVGTGVPTAIHGVRAIEGVQLRGGPHVIQTLSRDDFVLRDIAESIGLARRQPLPPTVRRRDYAWEIVAARGIPATSVNWWTTETGRFGALDSIGQESLFAAAKGDAVALDDAAVTRFLEAIDKDAPQLAAVYLPALDVVLNRLPLDPGARLAASVRALDGVSAVVAALRHRGYDVILIGLPGDRQSGDAVIASTLPLSAAPTPFDLAPTLLSAIGFPASDEMPGRSLVGEGARIPSYGPRNGSTANAKVDEEYYRNLKSLGYIK